VAGLVVAVVVVAFAAQNTRRTNVHFLAWHVRWPLVVIVAGSALAGAALTGLGGAVRRRRQRP
jgi:uncharacterized integral membrane protein